MFVIMERILSAFTMLGPADKPNNPHTTKIQDTKETIYCNAQNKENTIKPITYKITTYTRRETYQAIACPIHTKIKLPWRRRGAKPN